MSSESPTGYNAAADLIERNLAAGRGAKTAFIDDHGHYSYAELAERVSRFANLVRRLGIHPEQRILLCLHDTIDFPTAFLGAIKAGVVPVAVNTQLSAGEFAFMLADSRARAVVVSAPLLPVMTAALAAVAGAAARADRLRRRRAGALARRLARRDAGRVRHRADPSGRAVLLALLLGFDRPAEGHRAHPFEPDADGRALCRPGARHRRERYRVLGGEAVLRLWARQRADLSDGGRRDQRADGRAADARRRSAACCASIGRRSFTGFRPSTMRCSPATICRSARSSHCAVAFRPASRCRRRSAGAGRRGSGSTFSTASARPRCCTSFSATGRTRCATAPPANRSRAIELKIVDEEGRPVRRGEIGDLLVSGPTSAAYYWNNRERCRTTFMGPWTRTGDKYFEDEDGYYVYCGRSDDMMKVSGMYVSPAEVEAALDRARGRARSGRRRRAGRGRSDQAQGVRRRQTRHPLPTRSFARALEGHARGCSRPSNARAGIAFLDDLPKTATGKIQRFKLREPPP